MKLRAWFWQFFDGLFGAGEDVRGGSMAMVRLLEVHAGSGLTETFSYRLRF